MNRLILYAFSAVLAFSAPVAAATVQPLPAPDMTGGKPLMQALKERRTARVFGTREIDDNTLSEMLWAAWGVNRPDSKKRTVPTAMNRQNIDVYVLKADGVWRYDGQKHVLEQAVAEDLRSTADKTAPVTLLYVADESIVSGMHAGSIYQNVGLFCASKGLNNVVRRSFDRETLNKALGLDGGRQVLAAQLVGWSE